MEQRYLKSGNGGVSGREGMEIRRLLREFCCPGKLRERQPDGGDSET